MLDIWLVEKEQSMKTKPKHRSWKAWFHAPPPPIEIQCETFEANSKKDAEVLARSIARHRGWRLVLLKREILEEKDV